MIRSGCIAVGEVHCDGCGRTVKHPERYLAIDEDEGADEGKVTRYCLDCCLEKGYARYKTEGGTRELTFLID